MRMNDLSQDPIGSGYRWFEVTHHVIGDVRKSTLEVMDVLAKDVQSAEDLANDCMESGRIILHVFNRGTYAEYLQAKQEGGPGQDWGLDDEVLPGSGVQDIPF